MKRYPKYKDSGVEWIGEIPEHWKITKIKYIANRNVEYGLNIGSEKYVDTGVRFIRTTDIDDFGNITPEGVYLSENDVEKTYRLQKGDFLISRSGTIGRAYVHKNMSYPCSYAGYLVRFCFPHIELSGFIFYITKSNLFDKWIDSISIESTIGNVNGQKYANFQLVLPDNEEIKIIANYLDHKTHQIDTLIEKKQKQIELLKEQRTAIINHAVTKGLNHDVKMKDSGIEWLEEMPVHWEVKRLKYMSDVRFSSVDRHIKDDELTVSVCHYPDVYYNEKMNCQTKLNIGSCSEQEYEKYQLRKDNVIITKDSESPDDIGVAVFVEKDMEKTVCGYHLALISTSGDELLGGFLFRFIQSDKVGRYFEVHSNGITRFGLGKPIIENLFVTLPEKSEQEEIIEYLDRHTKRIDTLIEIKKKQIDLFKQYRTTLISDAVTGKIDVRNEVPT